MIHGANLEYQDIALRNTLFWAVYNNNRYIVNISSNNTIIINIRALAMFLIQCGARVRPWSWLQTSNLPEPLRRDAKLQVREIFRVLRYLPPMFCLPTGSDLQCALPAPEPGPDGRDQGAGGAGQGRGGPQPPRQHRAAALRARGQEAAQV